MAIGKHKVTSNEKPCRESFLDFRILMHKILNQANINALTADFLKDTLRTLAEYSGCDAVELKVVYKGNYHCELRKNKSGQYIFKILPENPIKTNVPLPRTQRKTIADTIYREYITGNLKFDVPIATKNGSIWVGDTRAPISFVRNSGERGNAVLDKEFKSLALVPIIMNGNVSGIVIFKSKKGFYFTRADVEFFESIAEIIAIGFSLQKTQSDLKERVKELTCLSEISKLVENSESSLEYVLKGIVKFLPSAMQYPKLTGAQITLNDMRFSTPNFDDNGEKICSDIFVGDRKTGSIVVSCSRKLLKLSPTPFLDEERNLINIIAQQIGLLVEKYQTERERANLQEQLRHADRLATIGQLSAGVAHELNEPLSAILGFAQLIKREKNLPRKVLSDLEKIIKSALHSREVIKKLMLFSRQMPPQKIKVNLNDIVNDGLYFLSSRCAKNGVRLVKKLAKNLPPIVGDPSQLHQVLVNLVVNAIQAMPNGGKLTITTDFDDKSVVLTVEDTGVGMSKEIKEKIFIPFFTTKEVGQGTGLGLPVVHGIVSAHNGSIYVESELGKGSKFEIHLPLSEK